MLRKVKELAQGHAAGRTISQSWSVWLQSPYPFFSNHRPSLRWQVSPECPTGGVSGHRHFRAQMECYLLPEACLETCSLFLPDMWQPFWRTWELPLVSSLEAEKVSLAHCCDHWHRYNVSPPGAPRPDEDTDAQVRRSLQGGQPVLAKLCLQLPPANAPFSGLSSAQASFHEVSTLQGQRLIQRRPYSSRAKHGAPWEIVAWALKEIISDCSPPAPVPTWVQVLGLPPARVSKIVTPEGDIITLIRVRTRASSSLSDSDEEEDGDDDNHGQG